MLGKFHKIEHDKNEEFEFAPYMEAVLRPDGNYAGYIAKVHILRKRDFNAATYYVEKEGVKILFLTEDEAEAAAWKLGYELARGDRNLFEAWDN